MPTIFARYKRAASYVFLLAGVATIITVIIQFVDRFDRPSKEAAADIRFGSFRLPPGAMLTLPSTDKLLTQSLVDSALADYSPFLRLPPRDQVLGAYGLYSRLRTQIERMVVAPARKNELQVYEVVGYWSAHVANTGTSELREVTLVLPATVARCIAREASQPDCSISSQVLHVGTLQPHEGLDIYAWTNDTPDFLLRQIQLRHAEGLGRIEIYKPVSSRWHYIANNWRFLLVEGSVVALLAILVVALMLDVRARSPRSSTASQ